MKLNYGFAILVFSLLINLSCGKEQELDITKIVTCYDETKGSDPWGIENNDSLLILKAKDYLIKDSIHVFDLEISYEGNFEACKASYCKTGRQIKATIDLNDFEKIQKLKFYECK